MIYHVLPFGALLAVAAGCGGSTEVRYGRHGPESRYVADLQLGPGAICWVFVHVVGGHLAAEVTWRDGLWTVLAAHGIQPADCPFEIWNGSAKFERAAHIPAELLTLEDSLQRHASELDVRLCDFTS